MYNNNDIVDSLIINSDLYYGLSVGKNEDGSNQWCYFDTPTPNSNNSSYCFSNITNEAIINIQSGWYEMSQTIIIEPQDGTIVFYTMDGSIPSSDDIAYTQPIEINENTVLSFRSFSSNKLPSKLNDRTFIFEEDNEQLKVFSIYTDPENLWSQDSGIYVFGNYASLDYPYFGSNFW